MLNKPRQEEKKREVGWSFLGKRNEPEEEEEEEEEEEQQQLEVDDGFAQLNAALNKRQEEKKKRSFGWSL